LIVALTVEAELSAARHRRHPDASCASMRSASAPDPGFAVLERDVLESSVSKSNDVTFFGHEPQGAVS